MHSYHTRTISKPFSMLVLLYLVKTLTLTIMKLLTAHGPIGHMVGLGLKFG